MGTLQICVARMLQESGIFFAVSSGMDRPPVAQNSPFHSSFLSWLLDLHKGYMPLTLLTAHQMMHQRYVLYWSHRHSVDHCV